MFDLVHWCLKPVGGMVKFWNEDWEKVQRTFFLESKQENEMVFHFDSEQCGPFRLDVS